jgi:hypothetical protein
VKIFKIIFLCALIGMLQVSCGAKLKSAGEVSSVFNAPVLPLQDHLETLCSKVKTGTATISYTPFDQNSNTCKGAGMYSQNYKTINEFDFRGVSDVVAPQGETEKTIPMKLNSQIWLNLSQKG